MTATLVRTGTSKRTSRQIEEDLRRLGADLGTSSGQDTTAIAFAGLSEFAEPLLQLVNELAREAAFPEAELERERRQKLEEVKLERTSPGFLAGERLRKILFGKHPYAEISPSEAQVAAYKRDELEAVYREIYTPENGLLMMVGDFDSQAMLKTIEKVFGGWTGKKPVAKDGCGSSGGAWTAHLPGAQSGIGADADSGGLPCDHAKASGLDAAGADQ